ncbi:MAG: hypothetical protein ACT4O1_06785 [Gemmatimonadota bacterium]
MEMIGMLIIGIVIGAGVMLLTRRAKTAMPEGKEGELLAVIAWDESVAYVSKNDLGPL